MQPGLYWLAPGERAERGAIAIACVPSAYARWALTVNVLKPDARCDGVEPVVKRVVAVAGDRIAFKAEGVYVNGVRQSGSARIAVFRKNTMLPHVAEAEYRLQPGELLLLGDNRAESWDGRYWGVTSRVLGRAAMVLPL
jgi:signal peptidase I